MEQLAQLPVHILLWSSVIILSLILFRFRLKAYWRQIVFSTVILTQVSFLIPILGLDHLMAVIQPFFLLVCFILILRITWLHSLVMVIFTYLIAFLVEFFMVTVLAAFSDNEFLKLYQERVYWQGIIIAVLQYLIALILGRMRLGFSFIPSNRNLQRPLPRSIYTIILLVIIPVALSSYSLFVWEKYIIVICATLLVLFLICLRLLYAKEISD